MPSITVPSLPTSDQPDYSKWALITQALTGLTTYVRKTTNQQSLVPVTLVTDVELILPLAINAVYEMEGYIRYSRGNSEGMYCKFVMPAGTTLDWVNDAIDVGGLNYNGDIDRSLQGTLGAPSIGGGIAVVQSMFPIGLLRTGVTAGVLTFQFGNTSTGTITNPVTIWSGSYIRLTRMS